MDFRKAFDTVPRARLIRRLQELGYDSQVIWAVVALYERVTGQVRIGTSKGQSIDTHNALRPFPCTVPSSLLQ